MSPQDMTSIAATLKELAAKPARNMPAVAQSSGPPLASPDDEWPELNLDAFAPPPSVPLDNLPPIMRAAVVEVARGLEVDTSAVALGMLGVCAGALSRCDVKRGGHVEPANIWVTLVGRPGTRKSALLKLLSPPLLEADDELQKNPDVLERWAHNRSQYEAATAKVEGAKKSLRGKSPTMEDVVALKDAEHELALLPKPLGLPKLVVDDLSPEALGRRLQANGQSFGEYASVVSAESSLDALNGKRFELSAALVLKTHAADPHNDERMSRESHVLHDPRLTMVVGTQPIIWWEVVEDPALTGRGFFDRFAFAVMPRSVPTGPTPDDINPTVLNAYRARVRQLAIDVALANERPVFVIGDDGKELIRDLQVALADLDGAFIHLQAGWAAKAHGLAQRLAATLWALTDTTPTPWATPIPPSVVADACALVSEWLAGHVTRLQDGQVSSAALALLNWIIENEESISTEAKRFSERELHQRLRGRARFKTAEMVLRRLKTLQRYGAVRELAVEPDGAGRPTTQWELRPELSKTHTQNPQNPPSRSTKESKTHTQNPHNPLESNIEDIEDVFPGSGEIGDARNIEDIEDVLPGSPQTNDHPEATLFDDENLI